MKSDRPYRAHILDSIEAIEAYVGGGQSAFLRDRMIQDAVIRNFEIIGEAAGRLSDATRAGHNAVDADPVWGKVVAFRNRLIHGYWSVDNNLVWDVIAHDMPHLKELVRRLLDQQT